MSFEYTKKACEDTSFGRTEPYAQRTAVRLCNGVCGFKSYHGVLTDSSKMNATIFCGSFMEAYSSNPDGATGYIWNLNFGQVVQNSDGYGSDYFYVSPLINRPLTGQTYYNYVSVQAKNACGVSAPSETRQFTVGPVPSSCSGGGGGCCILRLSPNPAASAVTVETTDNSEFTKLRIVDKSGQVKKQLNYAPSKKVTLGVADLPADVYRIQAFINNNWTTLSFIKQ